MNSYKPTKMVALLLLFPLFFTALTGCRAASASRMSDLKMAAMDGMPDNVKSAPTVVKQAYQFATANPAILKGIPCYCGCDDIGHTSNYSCYISGEVSNGGLTYDAHALGCSICVDITQDAMRMVKQGKPVGEIKSYIDHNYSQYGPSNMP